MRSTSGRVLLLALLAACASCSDGSKGDQSEATASAAARDGTSPTAKTPENTTELAALVDFVVAEANQLPRAEFDPAALAAQLGKDPQAHFSWVRDNTWWAPYQGLLRGSAGVMLDRVGSNLDRAILLGDLLRHAGHTVRLVHAQLPESQARKLLSKLRPVPNQRSGQALSKPVSAERQRALETLIPGEGEAFQRQIAESRRRQAEAEALIGAQSDRLFAIARGIADSNPPGDEQAIAALQDHWWVEREETGRWIAMDVLLPNAKVGEALASASSTHDWKSDAAAPSIPDGDWHSVGIRVVVERYENGVTTESAALETMLRTAQVLDRPITLFHRPDPWPGNLAEPEKDPNALGNAAVNVREWVPVLQVGNEFVAQSGFSESGILIADALSSRRDVAEAGGGGFMSGFGEALGGDVASASSLTAEWIDYEIRVPGMPVQRLRRTVFDVLGPARRATKTAGFDAGTNELLIERYEALLSTTDILLQACNFTEDFVADLGTRSLVANQSAIRELSRERDPEKARALATSILERLESWGPLTNLVVWRSAIGARPDAWFIDRPNVLTYRVSQSAVNADRVAFRHLIDIATNATGVHRGSGGKAFEVRLRRGVADTVAEVLALGNDVGTAENAASLFGMTDPDSGGDVLIKPREAGAVKELGWPADTATRLAMDVDAGFMAVTIKQPVSINGRGRLGWWRVDPATGETIGVMDNGYHANTSEDVAIRERVNALRSFLDNNRRAIRAARQARRAGNATPNQNYLLRVAEKAEDAISAAAPPPPV